VFLAGLLGCIPESGRILDVSEKAVERLGSERKETELIEEQLGREAGPGG
jgi:hypothetical protein